MGKSVEMYKQPKPIIRPIPHGDLFSTIGDAIRKQITHAANFPFQNCLNCKHWKFDKDLCGKYNAKPPTEIIVYSCPAYEDFDDIPF